MPSVASVKKVSFTFVIFIICLIIFILDFFVFLQHNTVIFSTSHLIQGNDWGILTEYGRLTRADVFAGQWWRLFTSIFLHAGVPHLAVNMIALLIVGFIVEEHSYIVNKMSLIKWILLILYMILPNLSGMVSIIAHVSGLFLGIIITLFMDSFIKMASI